jgi:transposase
LDINFWGFFMAKYSEQFKLAVVKEYLSDSSDGYLALARRYGLTSHSMVQRWVLAYRLHGEVGLQTKSSQYSAQFKLSVLRHMWDNQLSITQAAARFDIRHHAMVGFWERAYRDGGVEALASRGRGRPKSMTTTVPESDRPHDDDKRSREELLAEVNQLRMELAYLKKLEALVQARPKQAPKKKRK